MTRRRWVTLALVLLVAVPAAAYAALALTSKDAPAPAHLRAAPDTPGGPAGPIDGDWAASPAKEDFVGYRIREKLGPLPAPDDAVGRTRVVSGRMRISRRTIVSARITADVSTLQSDAPPRDSVLHNEGLESDTYPRATFDLDQPVDLGARRGAVVSRRVRGTLRLHDVRRHVAIALTARWNGPSVDVAGSARVRLADYRMSISQRLGLRIADTGTMEFELTFVRAGRERPTPTVDTGPATAPMDMPRADLKQIAREPVSHVNGALAVVAGRPDDLAEAYIVNADGSGVRGLTHQSRTGHETNVLGLAALGHGAGFILSRQESPPNSDPPPPRLFRALETGGRLTPLTPADRSSDTPALSPSGDRLAFSRLEAGDRSRIYVSNVDGSGARALPAVGSADDAPSWSPDGRTIAFTCFEANEDICVVGADGSDPHRLTSGPAYDSRPTWSPDGSRIAFSRDGHICTVRADGTRPRYLTRGLRLHDTAPAWSPDGRRIAFVRSDGEPDSTFTGPGRLMLIRPDGSGLVRVRTRLPGIRMAVWR
jgi:polyisoprenoid-binding protein YceI